jgi:hypothetical protein
LLVMCAARPKGQAWSSLAAACKQDKRLSEAIVGAALGSAAQAGRRLFASQAVVADEASQAHWRSTYSRQSESSRAWSEPAWGSSVFFKASQEVLEWGVLAGQEREARPGIVAMLDLAKRVGGEGSLAWKASVANKPEAVVGLSLWGEDLDAAGPDGLRPVDVATRMGRALLYRALALAGADCETKGRGSRKTPAELGKKLLRDDLGADLLSAAERAEIASSLGAGTKNGKQGAMSTSAQSEEGGVEADQSERPKRPRL